MPSAGMLHHVEINVSSLKASLRFWEPLLLMLGYREHQNWHAGRGFRLNGTYFLFLQAKNTKDAFNRRGVGLSHVAFLADSREQVDQIAAWVRAQGFRILYENIHPFAGDTHHYALYCEDPDMIKVEIIAPASAAVSPKEPTCKT